MTLEEGSVRLLETEWPLPHRGPANTAYLPDGPLIGSTPVVDWQVNPAVPPEHDHYEPDLTEPVLADGRLYTVNRLRVTPDIERPEGHFLRAYDTTTGEQIWEYTIEHGPGRSIPTSPAVDDDVVLVGQGERVHAIDVVDGTIVWSQRLENSVEAIYPTPDQTYVNTRGSIVALNSSTESEWTREFDTAPVTVTHGTGALYVTVNRRLFALNPTTGDENWQVLLPAQEDGETVKSLTTVAGGVLVLQYSGMLSAVNASGDRVWSDDDHYHSVSTDGSRVYAGMKGRLRALRVRTGDPIWDLQCRDLGSCGSESIFDKPVVTDSALYTSLNTGQLVGVRPTDGTVLWTLEEPTNFRHLSLDTNAIYGVGHENEPLIRLYATKT